MTVKMLWQAVAAAVVVTAAPAAAQNSPAVTDSTRNASLTVGPEGAALRSADRNFELKLRGYLHEDARLYAGDDHAGVNTFVLRRVRPVIEATAFRTYSLRLMPDFGNGSVVLQDAYVDLSFARPFNLRFGKFKPPVGLERLMSATAIPFIERAFPTALVPNRDVGVQLSGEVMRGSVSYAAGVFNGVDDGGSADSDINDDKEAAVRLYSKPFTARGGALRNLGLGVAATTGTQHGTTASPGLASYRTPGQNSFFSYRTNVIADGPRRRVMPQGAWYAGRFSAMGEYVLARHTVRLDLQTIDVENSAWQLTAGLVLTGGQAGERGVKPAQAFDPARKHWGAVELTARMHALDVDGDVFPQFADPERAARAARAWGIGVNWYLNQNVKFVLDYDRTAFKGGAPGGADRAAEQALFGRIQFAL